MGSLLKKLDAATGQEIIVAADLASHQNPIHSCKKAEVKVIKRPALSL